MATLGDYVPSYMYEDVFTGKKYSPGHPLPRIMQNPQPPREIAAAPIMIRNLDLNSGPSTFVRFEDHHVHLLRESHQRSRLERTYWRPRETRVEQNPDLPIGNYRISCPETMVTVAMVVERRRTGKRYKLGSRRFLYDRTADDYDWLPSGWLCEERIMVTGRLYKYYYSPKGYLFYSKLEALGAMSRRE